MNYCFLGFCRYLACKTKHIASLNFYQNVIFIVLWHMQTIWKAMGCLMSLKSICGLCEKAVSQMMTLKHTFFHHMLKCNPNETNCMKIKKLNISMTQFHSAIAIIMAPKHESFTTPPTLPPLYKHPPPRVPLYVCLRGLYLF